MLLDSTQGGWHWDGFAETRKYVDAGISSGGGRIKKRLFGVTGSGGWDEMGESGTGGRGCLGASQFWVGE